MAWVSTPPKTSAGHGRVSAVLGPTNTGKTHLAVERMLEHQTGIIGFPLRLLARENYDKLVRQRGRDAVALVTGEEKIVPPHARWFVCTVEAMPLERRFDFLAVDEIQLAADRERGHVFTDRLLHARGQAETMFLGADTMRPLLRTLLPATELDARPRFSVLSHVGSSKLARLPPRSAVVAFSVAEVYRIAESLRRHKGGTAVVLGALSPRTRNAQVKMYQDGEVDYLVATDAIGMGLNLDVDHVAFAALAKFDGEDQRELTAAELAQIAGRAGRFMKDGTFGVTGQAHPLDADVVSQIEHHRFAPLETLVWRNSALDLSSVEALRASLDRPSPHPALVKGRVADDVRALGLVAGHPDVRRLVRGADDVRLLWEACQIPDFRKISPEDHAGLIAELFVRLHRTGTLPAHFVEEHLTQLDRQDGDVEDLIARMAHVRTWSYIAFRAGWLDAPDEARELARAAEDRLSDALHERLQRRFVDRLASAMRRSSHAGASLDATLRGDGSVVVEGAALGRLSGFRFEAHGATREDAARLGKAAARGLKQHIAERTATLLTDPDPAFAISADATVTWRSEAIARLTRGTHPLEPDVEALPTPLLEPKEREQVRQRAAAFVSRHIRERLSPLVALTEAELNGPARGIAYQLGTALGAVPRRQVSALVADLSTHDRRVLYGRGVRLGFMHVFMPSMLKLSSMSVCAVLAAVHQGLRNPLHLPLDGHVSFTLTETSAKSTLGACGFERIGSRAYRVDILDRVAGEFQRLAHGAGSAGFEPPRVVLSWLGAPADALTEVVAWLGYLPNSAGLMVRGSARTARSREQSRRRVARGSLGTLGDAWGKR